MEEKSSAKRFHLQLRPNDKETLQIHSLKNKAANTGATGYHLDNEETSNFVYSLLRFPVTSTFDYVSKNTLSMWAWDLGLSHSRTFD